MCVLVAQGEDADRIEAQGKIAVMDRAGAVDLLHQAGGQGEVVYAQPMCQCEHCFFFITTITGSTGSG